MIADSVLGVFAFSALGFVVGLLVGCIKRPAVAAFQPAHLQKLLDEHERLSQAGELNKELLRSDEEGRQAFYREAISSGLVPDESRSTSGRSSRGRK